MGSFVFQTVPTILVQAGAAASLGAHPWRVFWRIKLPLLLQPLLVACAVAFAVSVAQYLPGWSGAMPARTP